MAGGARGDHGQQGDGIGQPGDRGQGQQQQRQRAGPRIAEQPAGRLLRPERPRPG
jgi:hypothetical protein